MSTVLSPSFSTVLLCGHLSYLLQSFAFPSFAFCHTSPHPIVKCVQSGAHLSLKLSLKMTASLPIFSDMLIFVSAQLKHVCVERHVQHCTLFSVVKTETQSLPIVIVHPTPTCPPPKAQERPLGSPAVSLTYSYRDQVHVASFFLKYLRCCRSREEYPSHDMFLC